MSKIYITQFDHDQLMKLLGKKKPHDDFDKALLEELERAEIVDAEQIPPDVITMNSTVRVTHLDTNVPNVYTIVFPSGDHRGAAADPSR